MTVSSFSDCRILYLYSQLVPARCSSDSTLFAGGAQKRTFQMAVHFAGLSGGVWLGSDDEPSCRVVRELEKRNVKHVRIPFRHTLLHASAAYAGLLRCVREHGIDLIHCNDRLTAMFSCLLKPLARSTVVYSARNVFHDKRYTRAFFGRNIVAVSEGVRKNLSTFFGIALGRTTVIYNGTDIQHSTHHEQAKLRSSLGLNEQVVVGTVVGRLSEQKGHVYLIQALRSVIQVRPDFVVLFVGDGESRDTLWNHVCRLGLEKNVIFCGEHEDVSTFIDISEFTIMPSLWEGLPGGGIESLMLGKAVVASSVGGLPEVVEHGVNGLLVPPADAEALAAGIIFMLDDPGRAREMGEHGRRIAADKFALSRMMSQYEQYYRKILGGETSEYACGCCPK